MNIASWSDRHVERYGDIDVLVANGQVWTNERLHADACKLASALCELGIAPGDRVLLALPTGREALVASTAVWRCGGVVVFIDPAVPDRELARVIEHCSPVAMIDSVPAGRAAIPVRHVISAVDLDRLIAEHAPLVEPVARTADDVAQLTYTSGSSGAPKALIYTHGSIDALLVHHASDTRVVTLVTLPPTAFASAHLRARWLSPNTLVALEKFEPREVLLAIQKFGVTDVAFVPSMGTALLAVASELGIDRLELRDMFVGGAHLPEQLASEIERVFGVRPRNVYGSTEAGGGISSTDARSPSGTVGRPLPGVEVRILRPDDSPAAAGEAGFVHVQTPWRAVGYWGEPPPIAERAYRDNGWIRTGDLGRVDEAGNLYLLGRDKSIIIQGGFNVSAQEVADVVQEVPGVSECAVIGMPDAVLGQVVVACVERKAGSTVTEAEVLGHCRSSLDPRKLPGKVRFLELPRTTIGKVKLDALRDLVGALRDDLPLPRELRLLSVAQAVEILQRMICDKAATQLKVAVTDVTASFASLGLTSLELAQLVGTLGDALGRPVPLTMTYRHPTIAELTSALVEQVRADGPRNALELVPTSETSSPAPTTQQYFWYLQTIVPVSRSYGAMFPVLIEGELDRVSFQRIADATVARHDTFKLSFTEVDGVLQQSINPSAPRFILSLEELPTPPEQTGAAVERVVAEMQALGLDLNVGVSVRGTLVALGPQRHLFVLMVHHAVCDADSVVMLAREILDAYGDPSRIAAPPPLGFMDWSVALERFAGTPAGRAQQHKWVSRLHGAMRARPPVDFPEHTVDADRAAAPLGIHAERMHPYQPIPVPPAARENVARIAGVAGTTPSIVYLAAYAALLRDLSGQEDMCIENVHSTRAEYGAQAIQGGLSTWTVTRIQLGGVRPFLDVVRATKNVVAETFASGAIHDYFRTVPPQMRGISFNYMPAGGSLQLGPPSLKVTPQRLPLAVHVRTWDLMLAIIDTPDATVTFWSGGPRLFRLETIRGFAARYIELLEHAQ